MRWHVVAAPVWSGPCLEMPPESRGKLQPPRMQLCRHAEVQLCRHAEDEEQAFSWASPISSHTSATSAEHTSLDLNVQQSRGDALRQPKAHHLHARHRRGGRHFRVRRQHLRKRYMISRQCCC